MTGKQKTTSRHHQTSANSLPNRVRSSQSLHLRDLAHVKPTLDDVGDHERGTGVVADEPTAGQVAFDLQSKQVPGEKGKQRGQKGGGHWKLLKATPSQPMANICTQAWRVVPPPLKWALPITIERTAPLQQS